MVIDSGMMASVSKAKLKNILALLYSIVIGLVNYIFCFFSETRSQTCQYGLKPYRYFYTSVAESGPKLLIDLPPDPKFRDSRLVPSYTVWKFYL